MLPNPFSSSALPKPNFIPTAGPTANTSTFNPGPGLPQAALASYSDYVPRPQPSFANRKSTFGSGRGGHYSSSGPQFLPFSCDLCDRSFKSKDLLDQHTSEHVPCGINGCKFVAHPKIVEKHVQMQHETGLAEKIMKLTTPEEIAKWKEERRKQVVLFLLSILFVAKYCCAFAISEISHPKIMWQGDKLSKRRSWTEVKCCMSPRKDLVSWSSTSFINAFNSRSNYFLRQRRCCSKR